MARRSGEKMGWTGGWSGGFLWVVALSVLFAIQGNWLASGVGFALVVAAAIAIVMSAPWRHPSTAYWKLLIPVYVVFLASAAWAIWAFGGLRGSGLRWWNLLWMAALLTPMLTLGKRRWSDGEQETQDAARNRL